MTDSAKNFYQTISNRHGISFETAQDVVKDLLRAGCFRLRADKRYLAEIEIDEMVQNQNTTVSEAMFEFCAKYNLEYKTVKGWYYRTSGERDI